MRSSRSQSFGSSIYASRAKASRYFDKVLYISSNHPRTVASRVIGVGDSAEVYAIDGTETAKERLVGLNVMRGILGDSKSKCRFLAVAVLSLFSHRYKLSV
jgi:hypothetical protein